MSTDFRDLAEQTTRDPTYEVAVQPPGDVPPKRMGLDVLGHTDLSHLEAEVNSLERKTSEITTVAAETWATAPDGVVVPAFALINPSTQFGVVGAIIGGTDPTEASPAPAWENRQVLGGQFDGILLVALERGADTQDARLIVGDSIEHMSSWTVFFASTTAQYLAKFVPGSSLVINHSVPSGSTVELQIRSSEDHQRWDGPVEKLTEHEANPFAHMDSPVRQPTLGIGAPVGRRVYLTTPINHPGQEHAFSVPVGALAPNGPHGTPVYIGASLLDFSASGGVVASASSAGFPAVMNANRVAGFWQRINESFITIAVARAGALAANPPTHIHITSAGQDRRVALQQHGDDVTIGGVAYRLMRTQGLALLGFLTNLEGNSNPFVFALQYAAGYLEADGSIDTGTDFEPGEYRSLGNGRWEAETTQVEMPFLHAILAPAVPGAAGLQVDESYPNSWTEVRFNRGTESSADWESHFTLPAVGATRVECLTAGRVQVIGEIHIDEVQVSGGGNSDRREFEARLVRTRGVSTTEYVLQSHYIREGISAEWTLGFATWVLVQPGDRLEIELRRVGSPASPLAGGRFGFMRLVGGASDGPALSGAPGTTTGAARPEVHPVYDQASLDAVEQFARVGGVYYALVILPFGTWEPDQVLVWDFRSNGWIEIGRLSFPTVLDYTDVGTQLELDAAVPSGGVEIVRITAAFAPWVVDDILVYDTTAVAWRKIGSLAQASPQRVPYYAHAYGYFADSSLIGGLPVSPRFNVDDNGIVSLSTGTAGPWQLNPGDLTAQTGESLWQSVVRVVPSGLGWTAAGIQVKTRIDQTGAVLYATDSQGSDAAEVPPDDWTHFSIRRPDGMRGPWIQREQQVGGPVMLFAIANGFRTARRYSLPAEIGTFRLSDYRYLEGRIVNYSSGYARALWRGSGALISTAQVDSVVPSGRPDQFANQYGLQNVYRVALGGPNHVASFSRVGSSLSAGDWSGNGCLIDMTFENHPPPIPDADLDVVNDIILHANGHPLDAGARFELWGIP